MTKIEFVVISLPGSTQRRESVRECFSTLPWSWRFFDAHTQAHSTLAFDPVRAAIRRGYQLRPGEVGCFSSHVSCLTEFASRPDSSGHLIVLEDDVTLDRSFDFGTIATLMEGLSIDYLRLFSRWIKRAKCLGRINGRGFYRFVVPPYGAQAYAVSKRGAQQFSQAMRQIDRPIDDEMDRYWINGLPTYAVFPYPAMERSSVSTIPKGFDDPQSPRSAWAKLQTRSYAMWERIQREQANLRLLARDRVLSRRIREMKEHGFSLG